MKGAVLIPTIIDPIIIDLVNPYPIWVRKCIKRKYGRYPAVFIDVWIPYKKMMKLQRRMWWDE